jgi:predicted O-methyltransferase YrrM
MSFIKELIYAVSHPKIAFSYLMRKKRIAELMQVSVREVDAYLRERKLAEILNRIVHEMGEYSSLVLGPSRRPHKPEILWAICRIMRPDVVVETGVQCGISSTVILQALEENDKGILYSIDLPDENILNIIPASKRRGMQSGWLIPKKLQHRWRLIIGRSQKELRTLLEKLESIDIFIHDSEHTFDNMTFEYNVAWRFLKFGGILLSDDIDLNKAFHFFAKKVRVKPIRIMHSVGALRK